MALDHINNRIQRRTTSAFELALPVLFTSGITHYAEIPAGMAKAPDYVRDFIKGIPERVGRHEIHRRLSRENLSCSRARATAAGIWPASTAKTTERKLTLDLSQLRVRSGTLITDGDGGNLSFRQETIHLPRKKARSHPAAARRPGDGFQQVGMTTPGPSAEQGGAVMTPSRRVNVWRTLLRQCPK